MRMAAFDSKRNENKILALQSKHAFLSSILSPFEPTVP